MPWGPAQRGGNSRAGCAAERQDWEGLRPWCSAARGAEGDLGEHVSGQSGQKGCWRGGWVHTPPLRVPGREGRGMENVTEGPELRKDFLKI